jgi:hypothetical protein
MSSFAAEDCASAGVYQQAQRLQRVAVQPETLQGEFALAGGLVEGSIRGFDRGPRGVGDGCDGRADGLGEPGSDLHLRAPPVSAACGA